MDQSLVIDLTATLVESTKSSTVFSKKVSATVTANINNLIPLPDLTDDKEIDLATFLGSNAEYLIIDSPERITVKVASDSGEARVARLFVYSGVSIDKIYLSNTSGVDVDVKIIAGG